MRGSRLFRVLSLTDKNAIKVQRVVNVKRKYDVKQMNKESKAILLHAK
jgi:hypothetical protein